MVILFSLLITVVNKSVIKRIQLATVEKKTLILPLPYEGDIFLQTRTKLRKSFKYILNCCKLQIIYSQREPAIFFRFKDCLLFDLVSRVVYKYTCEGAILPITVRQIDT